MNYKHLSLFTFHFSLFTLLCVSGYSQKQYYVSTFAGGDSAGMRNGAADSALFNGPSGIATDAAGNIYIADTYNNVIRKITISTDMVTTIAGDTTGYYKGIDSIGGYKDTIAAYAKFNFPLGVCVDRKGNVYVADTYNQVIRKISTSGMVSTLAGRGPDSAGYKDTIAAYAQFNTPLNVAVDTSGNVYVVDNGNNAIREISVSSGMVTTVFGRGPDSAGYVNGTIDTAEFEGLYGIALGDSGKIFISQFINGGTAIRLIYKGKVSTYAGLYADTFAIDSGTYFSPSGYKNGKSDTALFNDPMGLAIDSGNVFVADEYNNVIRKINASDSIVSTFAGNNSFGFVNNWYDSAEFFNPFGITADNKENFYVTDNGNNAIRKIALTPLLGIAKLAEQNTPVRVYPNPNNGIFSCQLSVVSCQSLLEIYNVLGEKVYSRFNSEYSGQHSTFNIDLSNQPAGVYFYKVSAENGSIIGQGKVIIE